MSTVETQCECCGLPCYAKEGGPAICHSCRLIATDGTYRDGSSPAERLSPASVQQIRERYALLTA